MILDGCCYCITIPPKLDNIVHRRNRAEKEKRNESGKETAKMNEIDYVICNSGGVKCANESSWKPGIKRIN